MSKARRKGTSWETAVVEYLNGHGFVYAERRALYGSGDRGDITGIPGVMLECKSVKEIELAAFMDEVNAQKDNALAGIGAAVIKRRMRPAKDAYVVMTLEQFTAMLRMLEVDREDNHAAQSQAEGTGESRTA